MDRYLDFDPLHREDGPRLACPFRPAIHPHVIRAHRRTLDWSVKMGLVRREELRFVSLQARLFAWLAARTCASATSAQLELVSDWLAFLHFHDELLEDGAAAVADPRELRRTEERIVEALRGKFDPPLASHPLIRAAADIGQRAREHADAGWLDRIANDMQRYLRGVRWERRLRHQSQSPDLATCLHLRSLTSAVSVCMDFTGLRVDGQRADLGRDPLLRRLELMANSYIGWVNDIYGLDEHLRESKGSNLVSVLAREEGLSMGQAIDRAIEICNAELHAFLALRSRVEAIGPSGSAGYVAALQRWMRGSLDWHAESHRLQRARGLESASFLPAA